MSDNLADLASWLPSEFLTGDGDNKTLLPNGNPHRLPYDFAYSSSTESESDDDDISGLTRQFTRSVSLQERLKIPYPVEKRVFSGSPESTLNWNVSGPTQVRSSPATPFLRSEEDAWDLIYAAAGQVARMKKSAANDGVFANRGILGAPRPPGPFLSHHNQNCSLWKNVNEVFIREQQHRERVSGGPNYGGGGRFVSGRPAGFGQSAWPPHPVETQRRHHPADGFVFKPVPTGSAGGYCRANPVVKKGCAGTGVFLPRNYTNVPPEAKKIPVCSPAHLPARVALSFNKNLDPIIAKPQPNINGVFSRQYQASPVQHHNLKCDELAEMIMVHRQNAMMLAQQRRSDTHEGVPATRIGHAEVVLPQEWTY
ncbi:hypothetical protein R6Q59_008959 [Mikania micrantha]|uniref:Uncharacterized protein n=1 Tax=Mikania micrantha TaxID=192012 RepID=A0A5N6Q6F3_9ASTR|nr:hypothetical protein E3N88_03328 [Mikania micrantha]